MDLLSLATKRATPVESSRRYNPSQDLPLGFDGFHCVIPTGNTDNTRHEFQQIHPVFVVMHQS